MEYTIKNNLPDCGTRDYIQCKYKNLIDRYDAKEAFFEIAKSLSYEYHTEITFSDKRNKPLRGTIQVEIDGFFYYVELYKMED